MIQMNASRRDRTLGRALPASIVLLLLTSPVASAQTDPHTGLNAPTSTVEELPGENSSDAEAMKDIMRDAIPKGGAEMGQRSARVLASKKLFRSPAARGTKAVPGTLTMATDTGHWRPEIGVAGQDVSGHQGIVDWSAQWNQGSRFAYVKASEGNYYTNESFAQQYNGSRNVGMVRGAYHFAIPNWSSGADQARYFVSHGGGWTADGYTLPPVLDIEYNPYAGRTDIPGYTPGDICYSMSASEMTHWIAEFGNTVKSLVGRYPVIYSTTDWWTRCTGNSAAFSDYPLWIAAYPASPSNSPGTLPASWKQFSLWQYSSTGPFVGDSNIWNGDYSGLKSFALGGTTTLASVGDFNADSRPDLVSIKPDGTLWFYPGNGNGGYGSAIRIGSGWQIYQRILGVGDLNGDKRNDLLAIRPDGTLWFYSGTGQVDGSNAGYRPAVKIGNSGWNAFTKITGVRDFNGDGRNDLLAVRTDGTLWFYAGTGVVSVNNNGYASAVRIGSGWNIYTNLTGVENFGGSSGNDLVATKADGTLWFYAGTGRVTSSNPGYLPAVKIGASGWNSFTDVLGAGDANGDGKPDIVTRRADKTLWHYAGTGMTDEGYRSARKIGSSGWDGFKQVLAPGDLNGDRRPDLIAFKPDGTLWFYAGDGAGGYRTAQKIGTGWNVYTRLVDTGDFNGDGKNDFLAIRPDGSLWFYSGTGAISTSNNGYAPGRKIGSGWGIYTRVVGSRDINKDGRNDLLAVRPDGTLWFYAGTATVSSTQEGYAAARKIGNSGWSAYRTIAGVGDFNGSGSNDLVAVRSDGTLWFYEGTGSVSGTSNGYAPARKIGSSGWNAYSSVLGTGDSNGDGTPDLVGVNTNGTLWFYAGTRMRNEGYVAAVAAGFAP